MALGRTGGGERLAVAPSSALASVGGSGSDFRSADAVLAAHGAGHQTAATHAAGCGAAGGVRSLFGGWMAFPRRRPVGSGDDQTATRLATRPMVAGVGRKRMAVAAAICIRVRTDDAASAGRSRTGSSRMAAHVRGRHRAISAIHAESVVT